MQKHMIFKASLLASLAAVASITACSSSSTGSGTGATGDAGGGTTTDSGSGSTIATLAITAPADNGTLALTGGSMGNITFTTTNFTLKAPGSCGANATNCGHVHVLIDGTACNDTGSGAPYNVAANASPAAANFSFCPTADGKHTVVLELHNDDHSPYLGADGKVVSSTISITTSG